MRAIIIIAVTLGLIYAASAAASVCRDTTNANANGFCNTTALQSKLPAKACDNGAGAFGTDFNIMCTQTSYDAWKTGCPKKNTSPEAFCQGTGYIATFCNLKACSSDSDCATAPVAPTSTKPCYNCCQVCQEDSFCDAHSGDGQVFAAKGATDCTSCATVAPTGSSSASCVAPVLALMGATAALL